MDKNKNSDDVRIHLDFQRSLSLSKQAKIMEFWKYIDSQDDLKPYEPSKQVEQEKDKPDGSSSSETSVVTKVTSTRPKEKITKYKKKDTKSKEGNGPCKLEKYFREDLKFADTVEVTYEEINAEIADYQRRLKECVCEEGECNCEKVKKGVK